MSKQVVEQLCGLRPPGLLVSVRSADEALAALAGGADVIDVKEPHRGALGAADRQTIADVVRAVAGRAPVTAAAGELVDILILPTLETGACSPMPAGVSLVKIGLSRCGNLSNWKSSWQRMIAAMQSGPSSHEIRPVAVIYADWQSAQAPPPDVIYSAALDIRCPVVLVDTWDKSAGTLFDHWKRDELQEFVDRARAAQMAVVLAGSLAGTNLLTAAELRPHLVAVRGAACDAGRNGNVSKHRVAGLRKALNTSRRPTNWHAISSGEVPAGNPFRHEEFS